MVSAKAARDWDRSRAARISSSLSLDGENRIAARLTVPTGGAEGHDAVIERMIEGAQRRFWRRTRKSMSRGSASAYLARSTWRPESPVICRTCPDAGAMSPSPRHRRCHRVAGRHHQRRQGVRTCRVPAGRRRGRRHRPLRHRRHWYRGRGHRAWSNPVWAGRDGRRDRAPDPAAGRPALHLWQPRAAPRPWPTVQRSSARRCAGWCRGSRRRSASMSGGDLDAITPELVARAADEGDPVAMDVIDRAGGGWGSRWRAPSRCSPPRSSSLAAEWHLPGVAISARPRRSLAAIRGSSTSRGLRSDRRVSAMKLGSSARHCWGGQARKGSHRRRRWVGRGELMGDG